MANVSTPNQCTLQPCGVTLCSSLNRRSIHTTRLRAIPLVRPCGMIRVRAVAEGEPKPVIRRKRTAPYPSPDAAPKPDVDEIVPTVMVEDYGVSVEGVAKVDREGPSARPSWGRVGLLAGGDVVALLSFAVIGRFSHGITTLDWDVVRTADPFIAGWLLGSYFLGGFGPEGQGLNGVPSAALAAIKSWAVGIPLGLVVRGLATGHVPPQPFILVSLGSLFFLMVGWRTVFTLVFPNDDNSLQKRTGNRQGGVFEFFELLTSLVRRW
ncbi:hypothetical protein CY35_15G071400 [Sphagnum magellanicum]|nr:hypothetical protein CY35_15G071400 [Sphagnum magellanicum]KAH9539708.1 hypothetical protein CY35_15G071400 [Sphagnum magellanicum]